MYTGCLQWTISGYHVTFKYIDTLSGRLSFTFIASGHELVNGYHKFGFYPSSLRSSSLTNSIKSWVHNILTSRRLLKSADATCIKFIGFNEFAIGGVEPNGWKSHWKDSSPARCTKPLVRTLVKRLGCQQKVPTHMYILNNWIHKSGGFIVQQYQLWRWTLDSKRLHRRSLSDWQCRFRFIYTQHSREYAE